MLLIDIFALPALPLEERHTLPECQAVYFVLEERRVLYVGQTRQLRSRWRAHHLLSVLLEAPGKRIAWVEERQAWMRSRLEQQGVTLFRPRYNKALVQHLPTYKSVTTTMPNHLYAILETLATRAQTPVSEQVRILIREALERRGMLILDP